MTNKWETTINIWATTTNYKQRQTKNNDKRKHTKKADHLDTRTTWTTLTNWATLTLTNQWLIKKIIAEFALFTWSCFISIVLFCHSFIILLSTLATLCTAGIRFWQFLSAAKSSQYNLSVLPVVFTIPNAVSSLETIYVYTRNNR